MSLLDIMNSYARGAGYVDPRETADTYQQILLQQSRDVNATNDMKRDSIDNLLDPDAIEKGTSPDYSKRMTESEFRNSGLARQPMSDQERWKNTIDSMIKSGNPVLQKQGLSALDQYFNHRASAEDTLAAEAVKSESNPTSYKEYLRATPPEKRSPEHYNQWLIDKQARQRMQINIDNSKPKGFVSVNDAPSLRYRDGRPVDPYTPEEQLIGNVVSFNADQQKQVPKLKSAINISTEINDMLFGDNGIYAGMENIDETLAQKLYRTAKGNVEYISQSDPRYKSYVDYVEGSLSPLVKSLGEAGSLATEDIDRARALIPTITGLHPDGPKVAAEKMNKLMRLIKAAQSTGMLTSDLMDALDVPSKSQLKASGWKPWWEKRDGTIDEKKFSEMKPFGSK
jgi:hypothetical protein